MRKSIAVAAGACLLGACGPAVRSAPFKSVPPRPPEHEIVLFSTKLPTCAYEEIGIVTAKPRTGLDSLESVLEALKHRAREMGGDAVVGLTQQQTVRGGTVVGSSVSLSTGEGLAGTVIRFADSACTR
jgi:hypothetical protein